MRGLLRLLFATVFSLFFIAGAHAGPVANVQYLHNYIQQKWNLNLPINTAAGANPTAAANMQYLLCAIDIANKKLNYGYDLTNYCDNVLATTVAIDTNTVNTAVDLLMKKWGRVQVGLTNISGAFDFAISASGSYLIDWGDGTPVQRIERAGTTADTYSHSYSSVGNYVVSVVGLATGYNNAVNTPAITFYASANKASITKVSGDAGAVFPIIGATADKKPQFYQTFAGLTGWAGEIPGTLFAGLSGGPGPYMFSSTFAGNTKLTGAIPGSLFANVVGAPSTQTFQYTFQGCTGLTEIPGNLFAGIQGAPQGNMFAGTFSACTGLTGPIPDNLFAGIKGAPQSGMFSSTFSGCTKLAGAIPENLFAGVKGAPASSMFSGTFYNCAALSGGIPANVFAGITGKPASSMFQNTFYGCKGLSGPLSENLFVGIAGAPASGMFNSTFYNCPGLSGAIPENLFAGISGAPASQMFYNTFFMDSGLSGPIPPKLFAGISGAAQTYMYNGTFYGCTGLTGAIPPALFGKITGAPAGYMFQSTFFGCGNLTGPIPSDLFGTMSGAPQTSMFANTFQNCSKLSGSIPDKLFGAISGAPATSMFQNTFFGCSGLSGSVPDDLFGDIYGTPATNMFTGTFSSASQLSTTSENFLPKITGDAGAAFLDTTFSANPSLQKISLGAWTIAPPTGTTGFFNNTFQTSGASASPLHAWLWWRDAPITGMAANSLGLNNANVALVHVPADQVAAYRASPSWTNTTATKIVPIICGEITPAQIAKFGPYPDGYCCDWSYDAVSGRCITPEFFVTVSNVGAGQTFDFQISAAGGFAVDWGDGSPVERLPRAGTTTQTTYAHTYANAGNYTIGIGGVPSEYNTAAAAISFYSSTNKSLITDISGDVGKVFPILDATVYGTPKFLFSFSGLFGWTGPIPEGLFAGLHGAPTTNMFYNTFYNDAYLTGPIPDKLFAGIVGKPAPGMFAGTFQSCGNLNGSIPEGLFAGISGAPAPDMFLSTFLSCTSLTGSIPAGLFANIAGAPADDMFQSTFMGCSGLSGVIPGNLFAGISGAPATNMFTTTFQSCSRLTGIGNGLFDNITGALQNGMFAGTFNAANSLTGPSATSNGQFLYEKWPNATTTHVANCYANLTGLSDLANIPPAWK
ncbi:MAG: hypothetical protein FWC61_02725 [Proteobacteria bacterium]|nr:hypothetical protein [Pseudomonadota bacterium]